MSASENPEAGPIRDAGDLQFERAEYSDGNAGPICANCQGPASPSYYEFNGQVFCTACRDRIQESVDNVRTSGSMSQAVLRGAIAAVLGAVIFYAVTALSGYRIGLISVLVGYLVGRAVRSGSGNLGGRRFQIVAVLLAYLAIGATYIPLVQESLSKPRAEATQSKQPVVQQPVRQVSSAFVVIFSFAVPVIALINLDLLSSLITGIALWEAWRLNRGIQIQFSGPFSVGAAGAASAP